MGEEGYTGGSPLSPGRWEGLTLREGFRELDIREGG